MINALKRLLNLNIERGGVTDYQLAVLLDRNTRLAELRLKKCFNVTHKTFRQMPKSKVGQRLQTLHFTKSTHEKIGERLLPHLLQCHHPIEQDSIAHP